MFREIVLNDIIEEISMGPFGSDIKVDNFVDFGIPVLNGSNLVSARLCENEFNFITEEKANTLRKANAQRGDMVITHRGTLGQVTYIPENSKFPRYVISQSQFRVKFKDDVDPIYLSYLFHTKYGQKKLLSFKNHVGVPALAQATTNFRQLKLKVHNLQEQREIATFLTCLDDKMELNSKINNELELMSKLIYDYWFVQFDFPDAEGRPYRSSGGEMVYDKLTKREIPKDWQVDYVGAVIDTALGGTPSTKAREYWDNGTISWLNSGEIANFPIVNSELKITKKGERESATSLLPAGTTLLSITRHLRPTVLAIDACVNQSVVGLKESEYFKFCFIYPYLQNEIPRLMSLRTGAQQPHINKETVDCSPILFPPETDTIMSRYIEKVKPLYDLIISNAFQNQELIALREWLLPMLMNGQVRIVSELKVSKALKTERRPAFDENNTGTLQNQPISISQNKRPFAKRVLGGKIVSLFSDDPHFTHIKFQKVHYLAEHIAQVELDSAFYFQAAGPYDPTFMHSIAKNLKTSKWFDERNYKWYPLEKQYQIDGYFDGFFKPATEKLDRLFALLLKMTETESEIVATLYAVWNNRILSKQSISEQDLISDFYAWSSRKQDYSEMQVRAGLKWITENDMQPVGFGQLVKRAKKKS